jgi:DNA-binding response OmpR family regulator
MSQTSILLVDDEAAVRELLTRFLEEAGFNVVTAGDYREAAALAAEMANAPELLITDVSLPDVNGPQLHQLLSSLLKRPLNVLFISGVSGAEILRFHGVDVSDIHFLPKPISRQQLLERLRHLLVRRNPFSAAW